MLGTWPIGRDTARTSADDVELAGISGHAATDKMTVWMTSRGRFGDLQVVPSGRGVSGEGGMQIRIGQDAANLG